MIGVSVQVDALDELMTEVRLRTRRNPWSAVTESVEVPLDLALEVTAVMRAAAVKTRILSVAVAVYDPAEPLQESVEVPDPETLVGVKVQDKPVVGLMLESKLTAPVNPSSAVTVMVEVPEAPARSVALTGLAAIVKS